MLNHKVRLDAGDCVTDPPKYIIYSGVVFLCSMQIFISFAELKGLELMMPDDIGNAYHEAHTRENIYYISGSEFGELAGHNLVFSKALYCLHT